MLTALALAAAVVAQARAVIVHPAELRIARREIRADARPQRRERRDADEPRRQQIVFDFL